jgi:hypothetical protein
MAGLQWILTREKMAGSDFNVAHFLGHPYHILEDPTAGDTSNCWPKKFKSLLIIFFFFPPRFF